MRVGGRLSFGRRESGAALPTPLPSLNRSTTENQQYEDERHDMPAQGHGLETSE
jgi:hypothetical protein